MTEKELVCLSLKDAADRIGELNHAPEKGFLYSGGVHCVADDGGGVGTFGLGAMPWPTIELKDGTLHIDGKKQEEDD